ncbi:hypothetical protein P280DRAFT_451636 [Massarina eburnea CBS 473.64]|uniref:Altered inheritance of mitochondria protein 32 n=1 Tax=Massarina eburnea CBS 473.64 TaxID=1395130 RepID=A0A6A6S0L9_9PLEO|nr:hypothetical protein P280DRAFT_451636 [Massarina eburnea CBS 473.64]
MSLLRRIASPTPHLRFLKPSPLRNFTTTSLRASQSPTPIAIPYTPTCPSPTCACAPVPPSLDIDRKSPLLNTMASYSEQVVVCTGKEDWTSRIEDDVEAGEFVRGVKGVVGKGGEGFDVCLSSFYNPSITSRREGKEKEPFNNILITTSSLPASETPKTTTALLFPSFTRLPALPHTPTTFSHLATAYLKARHLHPMHDSLSTEQKAKLTRDESLASELPPAESITHPVVLICGHGGRDKRCGILGPILREGFKTEFARRRIKGEVGLISHIGGHKYAGNVIIYLPPNMRENALKGTGIWYGRIGPEEVEGIVQETIVNGNIVADLFRGGIGQGGINMGHALEAQLKRDRGESDEGGLKLRPRARR